MKATIIITDDSGNTWQHELSLSRVSSAGIAGGAKKIGKPARSSRKQPEAGSHESALDLSIPVRPFIKQYARGLSGARKFTLLLARLVAGNITSEVPLAEIQRQWSKMTGLMGGEFNAAHAARARDNGWVDSPKYGTYKLLPGWESVTGNA